MWVAKMVPHIIQFYTHRAVKQLQACHAELSRDARYMCLELRIIFSSELTSDLCDRYSAKRLDAIAALNLLMSSFNGPATKDRLFTIKLGMRVIISARVFSQQQIDMLNSYVLRLETITQLGSTLNRICDNSWLYWHRNFVSMYLRELYNSPTEAHRLPYLFASLRDCTIPLLTVKHEESPQVSVDTFQNEICGYVESDIVRPLCRDIENDLRLHIHTGVVRLDDRNPFKVGLLDLTHLLRIGPLNFLGVTIDIKAQVTHYLDTTFYNLNTVALHDWKVYGQMRNLAEQK